MAAAVAAVQVLRRCLRGESPDPAREVDGALSLVISLFAASSGSGTTIVAFRSGQDIDALVPALWRLADE
jgi:hypothetical protein